MLILYNKKILHLILALFSINAYCMHEKRDAQYWNTQDPKTGNTRMLSIVAGFFTSQDTFHVYVHAYKHAITEGGDTSLKDAKDYTIHEYFIGCFIYKLFGAIKNREHKNIISLLSSAPELCVDGIYQYKETPLEYAIRKNNIFAQAVLKRCKSGKSFPKNNHDLLNIIAEEL
jgi:hypothetical protein